MKIYTRTGDTGQTALFGGGRVPKNHLRVEAYGEVDELNAALGLVIAGLAEGSGDLAERLRLIQEDLFAIGAHLATPGDEDENPAAGHLPDLPHQRVGQMEEWIDVADESLEPLRNFVLPGGTEAAARFHLARAICRRAERRVLSLTLETPVDSGIIIYLNRLSDLLFTLARQSNQSAGVGDVPWIGRR